jgi:hypothetical protein
LLDGVMSVEQMLDELLQNLKQHLINQNTIIN